MQVPIQTHDDEPDLEMMKKANALFAEIEKARQQFEGNIDPMIDDANQDIVTAEKDISTINEELEKTAQEIEEATLDFLEKDEEIS